MILPHKDYIEYLSTHLELLFFTGHKMKIIPGNMEYDDFLKIDLNIKFKCREALAENKKILDEYLSINSDILTIEKINILNGFKKQIISDFLIYKCLRDYAVFIDVNDIKYYAVKGLGDRFDELFDRFPVLVSTIILPYKDQIIYDGFLRAKNIHFGSGMVSSFNESYKKAKKNGLILTTL